MFIAEGARLVEDLIRAGARARLVIHTDGYSPIGHAASAPLRAVSERQMARLSELSSPPAVLAVFERPSSSLWADRGVHATSGNGPAAAPNGSAGGLERPAVGELVIALDAVQNPGNVGAVVRSMHWFGVYRLFCGDGTADPFGPKVVQQRGAARRRLKLARCRPSRRRWARPSACRLRAGRWCHSSGMRETRGGFPSCRRRRLRAPERPPRPRAV